MKFQIDGPIARVIFWIIMLVIVILYWPNDVVDVEKEVVIETHYVYVPDRIVKPKPVVMVDPIKIEEPVIPPKYGFTYDDIYLMTVLLCGSKNVDGDGEYDIDFGNQDNHEQISLVLSVVMNRVMSNQFPNTVSEVIWAPNQFHPMALWGKGLPEVKPESFEIVKAWCEAYDSHDLSIMSIPETHLYFRGDGVVNRSRERW